MGEVKEKRPDNGFPERRRLGMAETTAPDDGGWQLFRALCTEANEAQRPRRSIACHPTSRPKQKGPADFSAGPL
jgi:hypothetical protein